MPGLYHLYSHLTNRWEVESNGQVDRLADRHTDKQNHTDTHKTEGQFSVHSLHSVV